MVEFDEDLNPILILTLEEAEQVENSMLPVSLSAEERETYLKVKAFIDECETVKRMR